MDAAMSAMIYEESILRVMGNGNHVKAVYAAIEDSECYNYGEMGHISYNCLNPRGNGGRSRANIATTEESPFVTLTWEQVKKWEQWLKDKSSECLTSLDGNLPTTSVTLPTTSTWAQVLRHKFLHPHVGIT
jgi:hypothetical protein